MAKAPPSWVKHGAAVWYSPALLPGVAARPRVSAVVDGEPWLLGGNAWVVRLHQMDPSYPKRYVNAASVRSLLPRTVQVPR